MTHYRFVIDKTIGGTLAPLILNQNQGVVNLSTTTQILFRFKKPSGGTVIEKVGTTLNGGTDGYAKYTFVDGDLDEAGVWYYWLKITAPSFTLATDEQKTFMVRGD